MLGSLLTSAAAAVRERSHERRAELFVRLMRPAAGATVLDLGGGDGSFAARVAERCGVRVTVADIEDTRMRARERYGFDVVGLAPEEALPFDDDQFDIVLCNSVIEHVTLPKDECLHARLPEREWRQRALARQGAFAAEIRRIGRRWFVQTPHPAFPIDAHTWLPMTNYLPHEATRRLVRFTDRYWVKHCGVADWHLLSPTALRRMFPDARIQVERLGPIPKSVICYGPA